VNLHPGKKVSSETNCNVIHSSSKKLSLLITRPELETEIVNIVYERSLLHDS